MIQFSKVNQPDPETGYTLDDNARALVSMCMHFKLTGEIEDLKAIHIYLRFIKRCMQTAGNFLNYVDKKNKSLLKTRQQIWMMPMEGQFGL